jgi:hypothetical protein
LIIWVLEFGFRVKGLGFVADDLRIRVKGLGFKVSDLRSIC